MNRSELGNLLRQARSRIEPAEVGLPAGTRRRVPGLRREEVAQLAGLSVDYIVRLEQGRGPQPSTQVLNALSRALRLDPDERDQLFRLAGTAPPLPGTIEMIVRPSVLRLMERMSDLPVMVTSATGDVLAQNAMSAALVGDFGQLPPQERNIIWQRFLGDSDRVEVAEVDRQTTARHSVSTLKLAQARYPADSGVTNLINELLTRSEEFARHWEQPGSGRWRSMRKIIRHPDLGPITLDCDLLMLPDTDQAMTVYSAPAGSSAATALSLLRVTGVERMPQDLITIEFPC